MPSFGSIIDALTNRIVNVGDPLNPQDVATKAYVDSQTGSSQSLHLNPTFDQVSGGKPVQWNDFFLTSGVLLASDNSAGNFVSGSAAKISPLTGVSGSSGFFSEGTAHPINDQQAIGFAVWAKTDLPTGNSPILEISQLTAVLEADCVVLGPNSITTSRTVVPTSTYKKYTVSFSVPPGHLFGRFLLRASWTGSGVTGRSIWYDESSSTATQAPPVGAPVGSITMFGGTVAPTGWLLCQGQSVLRTDYPVLFGVVGTAFGAADSTHFNLPDMRARAPMGLTPGGSNTGNIGATETSSGAGGTAPGAGNEGRLNHRHAHTNDLTGAANAATTGSANRVATVNGSLTGTSGLTSSGGVGPTLTDNMANHAFLTLNYIIRTS